MTATTIAIYLNLYGHDLDPDQITSILQLEPSVAGRRGASMIGKRGQQYAPLKSGVWGFKIKGSDPAAIVDQFLAHVGQRNEILKNLPNAKEGYIEIYVLMNSDDGDAQCSVDLSASQQRALSAYGLPLRFTFDVVGLN